MRGPALAALAVLAAPAALAQGIVISAAGHYTENRGWNEAGLGPTHQVIVVATVAPSGLPTLAYAEKDGAKEPMTHFPQPGAPDAYVLWKRFDPGPAGAWRITAERAEAKAEALDSAMLRNPQKVPLATNVRVAGQGTRPTLRWALPRLEGFDIERIRVAVRGGTKVHGRFLVQLHVSAPLAPTATSLRVPQGWLAQGERYVFQVMLEDLEDDALENRSMAFSDPYTPAR